MTITLTDSNVYFIFLSIIFILQIIQQFQITSIKKEIDEVWNQIAILAQTTSTKVLELEKEILKNAKENRK
jgi:hypothetical protein